MKLSHAILTSFLLIIFLYLFYFHPVSPVLASDVPIFFDDFNDVNLDTTKWNYFQNDGDIFIESSIITLSSFPYHNFPYIRTNGNPFSSSDDFTVEYKARFPQITPWGVGLLLCSSQIDNLISRENPILSRIFTFHADTSKSTFWFRFLNYFYLENTDIYNYAILDNNFHIINLTYHSGVYNYYIDGHHIYTGYSFERPVSLFFGSPYNQQSTPEATNWTSIQIDYIKIFPDIHIPSTIPTPSPTPSATPTPTPVHGNEKVPIIFIPGHGASWNTNQILKNEFSDNNNGWGAIPYFYNKVYGSFLAELRNEYPEQVYNFYYDWRQESSKSIDKLYRFIEDKSNKDSNKKFILIAHSYGGLIARGYLHKYGNSHIQKIITAGTPHEGVLFAYNLWEGGDVIRGKTYERFIQELPIRENQIKNITKRAAARKTAPSTKDLLPIFPYLFKDNENNPISISSMAVQNTFLQNLKSESGLEKSYEFKLFKGDGQDTVEFIKVKDRDWLDLALGNWEDGHPVSYVIYKNGDDTVLTKSSQIDGIQPVTEPLSHGDLFSNEIGMRNIFNELGITISNTFHYNQNKVNKALVFVLHSPACLRITDSEKRQTGCAINSVLIPESESDENSQMAVIGNPLDNYQIEVLPVNGGGKYKLTIAEYDDNSSNYHDLSGEVLSGNTDIYNLSSIAGNYHLMPGLYLNNIKDKLSQVKEQAVNSNFDDDLKSILKLHLDKEIQLAEQIMSLEEYNDENKLVNDLETLIRLISGTRFTLANHIKNKDDNYYNIKSILYSITDDIKNLAQSSSQAHPYAYLQAQIKANSLQESLIEERLRKIADNNDIKEALIILEDARSRQNLIEQQFRDNPEKIAPIDLLIVKSYLLESSLTAGHLD